MPLIELPLIELLLGEVVLGDVELVSAAPEELLPVVPDVLPAVPDELPDIELAEPLPIIALVSVHAPLVPCRQPVSVMVFDAPVALWSQLPAVPVLVPDVPVVLPGDDVAGSCVGVPLVPDWDPPAVPDVPDVPEPDCATNVTANAQAMATLDAVVTTLFMSIPPAQCEVSAEAPTGPAR